MLSRDTMVIVAIAVCVIATVYLFKEMRDMKAIVNKPPQILRVPYPVQMVEERKRPVMKKRVEVEEVEEDEEDEEDEKVEKVEEEVKE